MQAPAEASADKAVPAGAGVVAVTTAEWPICNRRLTSVDVLPIVVGVMPITSDTGFRPNAT